MPSAYNSAGNNIRNSLAISSTSNRVEFSGITLSNLGKTEISIGQKNAPFEGQGMSPPYLETYPRENSPEETSLTPSSCARVLLQRNGSKRLALQILWIQPCGGGLRCTAGWWCLSCCLGWKMASLFLGWWFLTRYGGKRILLLGPRGCTSHWSTKWCAAHWWPLCAGISQSSRLRIGLGRFQVGSSCRRPRGSGPRWSFMAALMAHIRRICHTSGWRSLGRDRPTWAWISSAVSYTWRQAPIVSRTASEKLNICGRGVGFWLLRRPWQGYIYFFWNRSGYCWFKFQ